MSLSFVPDITQVQNRSSVVKYFKSGDTFVSKASVMFDVTDPTTASQVVITATASGKFAGIALAASTVAGQWIPVAVSGYVKDAIGDGSVTASSAVAPGAGVLANYAGTEAFGPVGIALEADAGVTPVCDVILFPRVLAQ